MRVYFMYAVRTYVVRVLYVMHITHDRIHIYRIYTIIRDGVVRRLKEQRVKRKRCAMCVSVNSGHNAGARADARNAVVFARVQSPTAAAMSMMMSVVM